MRVPCVLVVDDNPINLELVSYLLNSAGCQVISAEHGQQALHVLAERTQIDAILCDIQMPVMDGYEFARRVRSSAAWCGIPMIAVSALAMVGDRDRILDAGFSDYLSKPIDPLSFISVLKGLVPGLSVTQELGVPVPVPVPAPAPAPLRKPSTGATVLVLDDTPANLRLKRDLLEPLGYRVVTADSPPAAWQLAKSVRPQLIISDVGMQVGSGFDFIAMVKADPELCGVPFIFLSSTHWDDAARERGLALGAVRYLRRPIESGELLREIRRFLGEAPSHGEPSK
ncbi:MAG TPA: response regulator [Ideonella sp.]|uniref:response regulator n=1 Tax=Ideonella sp. TaxID=1929293 RepID=UPI002E379A62|nr:response regulator [Ideonella sp.]HEX5685897.1 response regulator [Ideonella sp.]